MYYEVIPTKIFQQSVNPSDSLLTYSSTTPLLPGQIVLIPLGKTIVPGIIYQKIIPPHHPSYKIKTIEKNLNFPPLPSHLLQAIFWLSDYYLAPLPAFANLILPKGITKKRRPKKTISPQTTLINSLTTSINNLTAHANSLTTPLQVTNSTDSITPHIPLNTAQQTALKKISQIPSHTKLLHGSTGSGKTNLYLKLALDQFQKSRSVILLVPEISLTPQLVQQFQLYFHNSVVTLHSKQTESERHQIWQQLISSHTPHIVIGARSAIFSPLQNLGLIIIDEAHDQAFFQENTPRYSALRLGSFIANTKNIDCLYGTATPLIEDYFLAQKNHAYVPLFQKAKQTAIAPEIHLIDLKDSSCFTHNRFFSNALIKKITQNLKHHHQTLIFHNRRGSAPLTICDQCGWQALCPNCLLPLTLHSDKYQLICHTCGHIQSVPKTCPVCSHSSIIHKGFGTKLLEAELNKIFKSAHIARFDTDNTSSDSLDRLYKTIQTGNIDILVGTQLLAKGLDLKRLETVGIMQADSGLSLPDFTSEERTFHLLTQIIGRVGRGHLNSASVYLQTYQLDHPIIQYALQNDYQKAYQYLIQKRQTTSFPPYVYLAKIYLTQKTEQTSIKKIREVHRILHNQPGIALSAPAPAFHEHSSSGYTWQIIIKSKSRQKLISTIQKVSSIPNLRYTLDPPTLL